MDDAFPISEITVAISEWEKYLTSWLSALANARQPEPTTEQIKTLREIWLEGFLLGRKSK